MPKVSASTKAGLIFSVPRVNRRLRKDLRCNVSGKAPCYLAAILEFVALDMMESAVKVAKAYKKPKTRVNSVEVYRALKADKALSKMLGPMVLRKAGVVNTVHEE